ncbi:hrpB [Symbiodinium natans]|uniref:HrpB protein n=1 Tax=Symbiodinium natans TaxID=878477 RepID=A0A812QN53_9DINO|nr:hrpB [Symbiodinium natans]
MKAARLSVCCFRQSLPISETLPEILDHFQSERDLVLQAPTGAGKTTIVPLALLESGHVDGKVILLQPRRLTALSVAKRMADLWGEPLGETIGYRIRHESVVSNRTRVEVVTEGVLVRMLNNNPTLEGISCIFFDEFHERSVESDLSFAPLGLSHVRVSS